MAENGLAGLAIVVCTHRRPRSLARLLDSIAAQTRLPEELVVVDASPDDATARVVAGHPVGACVSRLRYVRASGDRRGLPRQRNDGLREVGCELVAFFDDDVVLEAGCLEALERTFHQGGLDLAGVGALPINEVRQPSMLWQLRRAAGIVPSLSPGRYFHSGFSTPWAFVDPDNHLHDGDWLPGCAMMWRTQLAREIQFNEAFEGYANGEDLDFSLRARRRGRLVLATEARVHHHHEQSGRLGADALGYATIGNAYAIHRATERADTQRKDAWFLYAHLVDCGIRVASLIRRRGRRDRWRFLCGYWRGYREVVRARMRGL